jgi:hypothetical protein
MDSEGLLATPISRKIALTYPTLTRSYKTGGPIAVLVGAGTPSPRLRVIRSDGDAFPLGMGFIARISDGRFQG